MVGCVNGRRRCQVPVRQGWLVTQVSVGLFDGRVHATSNGRIRARGTAKASIAFPQRLQSAFFPCREVAAFLAGQKSRLPPSSAMLWA
jgi:hypothetical protein